MACLEAPRRLIVNADDFGRTSAINQAVITAHRQGILTTASLMVNGLAAEEAVQFAHENPRLGVGLHLTLVCGQAALPQPQIPGLVDASGAFSDQPIRTGLRYFSSRALRPQLGREIEAQLDRFRQTGLVLDHLNGHLNLQLHPTVFGLVMDRAQDWGIRHFRLTHDPLGLNLRLASGAWFYRLSHGLIFGLLSRWAKPKLRNRDIRHTQAVFGLLQNGRVTESYVLGLLPRLPAGESELYSHPSVDQSRQELAALISERVVRTIRTLKIKLIRYQDL